MNYNLIKGLVSSQIKTNDNYEVTAQIVQDVMNAVITVLGTGYQFAGVATPQTTPPVDSDAKLFYICGEGTYSNFGNDMVVPSGSIGILTFQTSWVLSTIAVGGGGGGGQSMTVETFNGVLLQAQADKYYRATSNVNSLTIQLPATEGNEVKTVIIGMKMGSTPNVTFTAADNKPIRYMDGYQLKANGDYEINVLYNGLNWTVAYVLIASN